MRSGPPPYSITCTSALPTRIMTIERTTRNVKKVCLSYVALAHEIGMSQKKAFSHEGGRSFLDVVGTETTTRFPFLSKNPRPSAVGAQATAAAEGAGAAGEAARVATAAAAAEVEAAAGEDTATAAWAAG